MSDTASSRVRRSLWGILSKGEIIVGIIDPEDPRRDRRR